MELPDFPEISPDVLQSIVNRHQLGVRTISRMPEIGIFNAIYLLDDELILRIPRNHPHFVKATMKEATVAPIVHAAGVRTPRLIVFDDSYELLPVPYSLYERVHGATLELIQPDPVETPEVYRELGHDLALLTQRSQTMEPSACSEDHHYQLMTLALSPNNWRTTVTSQSLKRVGLHIGSNA